MVGWTEENTKRDPEAKEGMRIQMISMDDQHAIDRGMQGTIVRIDDLGTLHVKWDDGSTLGVIPEIDEYQLLPNEDNITTPDNFMDMFNENQSLSKNLSADWKKSSNKEKLNLKLESKGGDIKTDVKKILDTLKTSKPNQRSVIENMVKNLIVKYKNHKKDEKKFSDLIENLYTKISNKFDIDETTTSSAMGSTPIQPLGSTIHKTSQKNNNTKGDIKNPTGVEYSINETTTNFTKNNDSMSIDGSVWVNKKKWIKLKNLAWSDGEIVDISKYMDLNGKDPILIKNNIKESKTSDLEEDDDNIEETTTMSSVFNGNFPVTPYMFSKKGKHKPSKKPMFNGGKIVQKTDRFDILNELNKVKWVKGGKYVKIKDRCAKYNNKPWCSQGDLDKPLQLSDNTFENIKRVSKKTGLSEEQIIKKIKNYINIV
jgi:hypothetical protein